MREFNNYYRNKYYNKRESIIYYSNQVRENATTSRAEKNSIIF